MIKAIYFIKNENPSLCPAKKIKIEKTKEPTLFTSKLTLIDRCENQIRFI